MLLFFPNSTTWFCKIYGERQRDVFCIDRAGEISYIAASTDQYYIMIYSVHNSFFQCHDSVKYLIFLSLRIVDNVMTIDRTY